MAELTDFNISNHSIGIRFCENATLAHPDIELVLLRSARTGDKLFYFGGFFSDGVTSFRHSINMRFKSNAYRFGESIYDALTAALVHDMTQDTFEASRSERALLDVPSQLIVQGVDVANALRNGGIGMLLMTGCEEHHNVKVEWDAMNLPDECRRFGALPYFEVDDDTQLREASVSNPVPLRARGWSTAVQYPCSVCPKSRLTRCVSFGKPGQKRTRLNVPFRWRKQNKAKIDGYAFTAQQRREFNATRDAGIELQKKEELTSDPIHLDIDTFAREYAIYNDCCGLSNASKDRVAGTHDARNDSYCLLMIDVVCVLQVLYRCVVKRYSIQWLCFRVVTSLGRD